MADDEKAPVISLPSHQEQIKVVMIYDCAGGVQLRIETQGIRLAGPDGIPLRQPLPVGPLSPLAAARVLNQALGFALQNMEVTPGSPSLVVPQGRG